MAYAFSAIKNALGQDTGQQKTNIFSSDGTDAGMAPAAGMQGGQQQQGVAKTNTEADLSGTGSSGAAPTTTVKNDTAGQQQGANQASLHSAGKTQNPALLNRAQSSLSSADTALQNESNAYVQKAKDKSYALNEGDINNYVTGLRSTEAGDALLNHGKDQAEAFKSAQNFDLNDVNQLQTDAGVKNALRNEGGNDYTAGMGAFDLAALHRTPGFDQLRASLGDKKKALVKKADDYSTSKTAEAQAALDSNLARDQGLFRTGLASRGADLTAGDEARAAAANAASQAGQAGTVKTAADAARAKVLAETDPSKRLAPYLGGDDGIDASQFYKGATSTGADMINADEASQFNRINAALGRSDPNSLVAAGGGARSGTFNATGYGNALYDAATGKRQARDTDLQSQIAAITGGFASRVNPDQERVAEMDPINAELQSQYGDVWGQDGIDSRNYMTGSADPLNYVNQGDLDQLNPLYKELGQDNPYAVGNVGKGSFDADAYKSALTQALAGKRSSAAQAAVDAKAQAASDLQHHDMQAGGLENSSGQQTYGTPITTAGGPLGALATAGDKIAGNLGIPKQPVKFGRLKSSLKKGFH